MLFVVDIFVSHGKNVIDVIDAIFWDKHYYSTYLLWRRNKQTKKQLFLFVFFFAEWSLIYLFFSRKINIKCYLVFVVSTVLMLRHQTLCSTVWCTKCAIIDSMRWFIPFFFFLICFTDERLVIIDAYRLSTPNRIWPHKKCRDWSKFAY